jgi:NIPSNAP protein
MKRRTLLQTLPAAALLPAALHPAAALLPVSAWGALASDKAGPGEKGGGGEMTSAVYELRVYHAYEGKLDDLLRRFRDHTMALFEKHGIKNVAYWTPTDDPLKGKTLVYMLAHPSREAAKVNWKAFQDDPEWQSVRDKSEANGKLVEKIDSTYLALTDFSPVLH